MKLFSRSALVATAISISLAFGVAGWFGATATLIASDENTQDLEAVDERLESAMDKIWSAADDEISTTDMVSLLAKWHRRN